MWFSQRVAETGKVILWLEEFHFSFQINWIGNYGFVFSWVQDLCCYLIGAVWEYHDWKW